MSATSTSPLRAKWRAARLTTALLACLAVTGAAIAAPPPPGPSPVAVVKALYAAFDRGDLKTVTSLVSQDVVWTQYGPSHLLPFAGVFHGPAGVAYFFKLVDENLEDVHAGQREYIVSGNRVIVPGWEDSVVRSTGGHYRVNNVHIFTVVDGRITTFEEYIDNADIAEAFEPASAARGEALFTACAGCHGDGGQGQPAMHAPNLTGLGSAYLVRELRDFRAGIRGNDSDTYGFMMMGRASALPGDRGLRDVAAFVDTLPAETSPASFRGDARRGRVLYSAHCAACHGQNAEGKPSLGAPSLRQQDETYLWAQLEHFAAGIRGSNAADAGGMQMRAALKNMPGQQSIKDVLAFIKSH
jgi:hypothetical protein